MVHRDVRRDLCPPPLSRDRGKRSFLSGLVYELFTLVARILRYNGSTFVKMLSADLPKNNLLLAHPRPLAKFTNSLPVILNTFRPADLLANNFSYSPALDKNVIETPASNVIDTARFGYVYCIAMMPSQRTDSDDTALQPDATYHLLAGSGDEIVKVGGTLI